MRTVGVGDFLRDEFRDDAGASAAGAERRRAKGKAGKDKVE